jgi:endo-1,4-beta-xylanase
MSTLPSRREALQAFTGMAPLWSAAGATLTARAFDPEGKPAGTAQLGSLLLNSAEGRPFELLPKTTGGGTVTIGLPGQNFELAMLLPVRGFGEVYLYADDIRGPEVLLNYEFARSRAAFVRRYVTAAQAEGVGFTAEVTRRLDAGETALKRASSAREFAARVGHSNDSLAETMWAGEMAALQRARHLIRRQGPRPGFLFGAGAFGYARSEEYAKKYDALLNFATLPFYRNAIERTEGSPAYSAVEAILSKMAGTPLLLKGHPLVWMHNSSLPPFLKDKSFEQVRESCRSYVLGSVSQFRSRIHVWDIINEAHDWANDPNYSQEQLLELTRMASQTTRLADPTAFRIVNCCCIWGEYVATRRTYSGSLDRPSRTPFEYLRALQDAGVEYDGIGLQLYCPGRDMLEIERLIERFFVFGKPIHITEAGIPSLHDFAPPARDNPYPINAVWHGAKWNEQIQADWVEQFYTLCYSMPQVQAITWWSLNDPGYIPNSGFLTRELKPKESYQRLLKLIVDWRS